MDVNIAERMRDEWNQRAKIDAHFYVAFGRQNQSEEDFLASAAEFLPPFEAELPRLPSALPSERRALEIGCGPARLMIAMSRHFGEIHGVDVSDEMVALARRNIRNVRNAQVHLTSGTDLGMFADSWFDFVYSYIVFQHIPSREIVLNYLREAHRVLKPGGVLCCQLRGVAPPSSAMLSDSDTWTGCWFSADDVVEFSRRESFPLLALTGLNTQYMLTTFRKARAGVLPYAMEKVRVKAVTAAAHPEPRIPARGPDAAVSLWIENMPESASLAECRVLFNGREQWGCYLSPVSENGGAQLNARLPDGMAPGECEMQMSVSGRLVPDPHRVTVFAPGPRTPRVRSVTDGINLTSRYRIETGGAKVVIEDIDRPEDVSFRIAGHAAEYVQYHCIDPVTSTYEFAFHLAHKTPRGQRRLLEVRVCGTELPPVEMEIV
ncbi:MAG TPA: class I SAM-dependent methyltransferase [Bryobacteraceae bacterium]|nr:class I SAM-dependent methyltransferase [Bryobacteraceae bacterium]